MRYFSPSLHKSLRNNKKDSLQKRKPNTKQRSVANGRHVSIIEDINTDYKSTKGVIFSDRIHTSNSLKIFQKVLETSELVVQVISASDPDGTRLNLLEQKIKSLDEMYCVLVMNKCDLIPVWVTKRWLYKLRHEIFTIAFSASTTQPVGKVALLSVLRRYSQLSQQKTINRISIVGILNVGKSSIVNTLKGRRVCRTDINPHTTKICQFVKLKKNILLIDYPGVECDTSNDVEINVVSTGLIRIDNLKHTSGFIFELMRRITSEHIKCAFTLNSWSNTTEFLRQLSQMTGNLLTNNKPDIDSAAKKVLRRLLTGRIPLLTLPNTRTLYDRGFNPRNVLQII
jgi:nuclear GTP-binding protein